MKNNVIKLLAKYDVPTIEKSLVQIFLDENNLKSNNNIYFAGQITGVEGYVESISSGLVSALNACEQFKKKSNNLKEITKISFSEETVIGALAKYISIPNSKFQPMNANFGILPELEGKKIKDKKERYMNLAKRSLKHFE